MSINTGTPEIWNELWASEHPTVGPDDLLIAEAADLKPGARSRWDAEPGRMRFGLPNRVGT